MERTVIDRAIGGRARVGTRAIHLFVVTVAVGATRCVHDDLPELGPPEPPLLGASTSGDGDRDEPHVTVPEGWAAETRSPQPLDRAPADLAPLYEPCGAGDAALADAAVTLAGRLAAGAPAMDSSELVFTLRKRGAPYVRPRAWTLTKEDGADDTRQRLERWLAKREVVGERRCGLARADGSDGTVVAAVVADAPADLGPIPTVARLGQWLQVDARLLAPASDGSVVVLAPRGAPKRVPSSIDDGTLRATFSADFDGAWTVQVVASNESGPRPVLEALVHVGRGPPDQYDEERAPGEEAADSGDGAPADDPEVMTHTVTRMVNAARASEGLPPLERDDVLDGAARDHAEAMRARGLLAHDVGDGDPRTRVERTGFSCRAAGENVAHARSLERAHRVVWASPSHRANLLQPRFDTLGVGVARDEDGTLWVCVIFAAR